MKYLCQVSEQYISLKLYYILKSESARKYLETLRSVKITDRFSVCATAKITDRISKNL